MERGTYARVNEVLNELLDLPEPAREAAISAMAASEDPAVLEEVRELLDEPMRATFLESPALDDGTVADGNLSGQRLGRLRIDELIARGGMGAVYRGYDELLGRVVAVKVLRQGLRLSTRQREHFLNEARSLSSVHHPNICSLFDFVQIDGLDLLALEFVEGRTLREVMRDGRSLEPLDILTQVTKALVAAHERGIAHRDLKPDNVMVTGDGAVKVLDFGLARGDLETDAPADPGALGESGINEVDGTLLAGTPGYMAPEQARAEPSTTATDLYALGVLMMELLEGRRPHPKSASSTELIERARTSTIDAPRNLPRAETALIRDLLQPDPGKRPTARAALERLRHIQDRPRRRLRFGLAAALIVAILGAGTKYTIDLQRSEAAAQRARGEAERLAGFMLNELHAGLEEVGRLDLLDQVATRSLAYYDSLGQEGLLNGRGEAPLALMQVGTVLDNRGRQEEARAVLTRATSALAELSRRRPDDELLDYRSGLAYQRLGETAKVMGDWDAALKAFEVAAASAERLTRGHAPGTGPDIEPSAAERWKLFLRTAYRRADTYVRSGRYEEAADLLETAMPTAVAAADATPDLITDLADIQYKACDAYTELARRESIVEVCRGARTMDKRLYEEDPDRAIYLRNYADSTLRLHDAYRMVGDLPTALELGQQAEQLVRRAVADTPENRHVRNDLTHALQKLGATLLEAGRLEEGRAKLEEALRWSTELVADKEEISFLHNHVTALLLLGRIEEARPFVRSLQERGFARRAFVELCELHGLSPEQAS